jgi:PAS domain S-box-containing protein
MLIMTPESPLLVGEELRDRLVELEMRNRLDQQEIRQNTALLEGTLRMMRARTTQDAYVALCETALDVIDAQGAMIVGDDCGNPIAPTTPGPCRILHQDIGDLGFSPPDGSLSWFCKRRIVRDLREVAGHAAISRECGSPRSIVSIPMTCGEASTGALILMHRSVGHFTAEDQALLRTLVIYAENALRSIRSGHRARLLADLVEGSTASLMLIEPYEAGGRILYVNEAFKRLSGRDQPEICGSAFLKDGPTTSPEQARLRDAFVNGRPGRFVVQNLDAHGNLFDNEIDLSRIEDDAGGLQYMLATHSDVTEQMAHERRQRELEARVREYQKNDSIGRLAAGVAHDFNNLLAVISGSAELLSSIDTGPPLVGECAGRITLAATRASKMINRFLDLGSPQSAVTTVDFRSILTESRDLLASTLDKNIVVQEDICDAVVPVTCEQSEILRMLINLLENARDAIRDGDGEIRQSLRLVEPSAMAGLEMQVGEVDPARSYCCYEITDTGCGIDAATMERLFHDSVSTKGPRGSGLGMLVVAEVVRSHRGALHVTTSPDTGTSVRVFLPRDDLVMPVGSTEDVGTVRLDGKLILLVDDDADVATVISTYLERLGAEVAVCNDPELALEVLEEEPGSFSMMLTDYSMPGLNGGRLADVAHGVDATLPIIVVTALARKIADPMLTGDHILAILPKPVDLTGLARLVAQKSRTCD